MKFGCLTEGLNKISFIGAYWNVLIMVRWTLTNAILLILRDYDEL